MRPFFIRPIYIPATVGAETENKSTIWFRVEMIKIEVWNTMAEAVESKMEALEGLDERNGTWGEYPLDDFLIRSETRTVRDVIRRIDQSYYIMNPDFQRDFIWGVDKQSKLIESVIMRIPLPVFYLAENKEGKMVVVDGLQRLSTFDGFVKDRLPLKLPDRNGLNRKKFSELPPKIQNRIEDCNLILYIMDSKVPERARLDIFERVNGGVPLTRQQMRNCLYMGEATRFLKQEARSDPFKEATGKSLNTKTMRDREFVNRFCAFQILGFKDYRGDMDEFLAEALRKMNEMSLDKLQELSSQFRVGLSNNYFLFGRNAFRKHKRGQQDRGILNASLWDVMSTGLSKVNQSYVESNSEQLRKVFYSLLENQKFSDTITIGTSQANKVKFRFRLVRERLSEAIRGYAD
ncbi:MAG: DUF262 domain-containing protein [Bacteroidota bacterium]|nr:DUF262 domain-containing protein [Bacteroidota bacterium]